MNPPASQPFDSLFSELYDAHYGALFRYILRLSGDCFLAEDTAAETFLRVWTAPDRLRIETVRAYLYAIARNLYLQNRRVRDRQVPLEVEHNETGRVPDYERLDEARRVVDALPELPEIDRSALLLRAQEGLSYEEIAQILGMTAVNARVKVHRARLRLAEICRRKEVRL